MFDENAPYRLSPSSAGDAAREMVRLGSELIDGVTLGPGDWVVEPLPRAESHNDQCLPGALVLSAGEDLRVGSLTCELPKSVQQHGQAFLTYNIREQKPGKRIPERSGIEQFPHLRRDVVSNVSSGIGDFADDLRSPVDDRDQILEIVTAGDVAASSAVKRYQLGRNEIRRGDQPNAGASDVDGSRCHYRWRVPAVREPQDAPLRRHDINDQSTMVPSAVDLHIGRQTKGTQLLEDGCVLAVAAEFRRGINVMSRPDSA